MPEEDVTTLYLPAKRLERERILAMAREIAHSPAALSLSLVPLAVTILNDTRQIVYANDRFVSLVGRDEAEKVLGLRLGEALGCVHARESAGGCGTTQFCQYCGAAKALVKSMEGTADTQECSITRREVSAFDALNLQVWTSPFSVFDHRLVLNSILDIAHEKSLRSFERIFFHDIMNAVTGIKGLHDIFALEIGERYRSELDLLHGAVESIRDIIESHKDFLEVETREYQCCHSRIETRALLGLMVTFCQVFNSGNRKVLRVDPDAPSLTFHSDPRLLQRILVNMVKNALEASSPGDVVTLGCQPGLDRSVTFQVRNPAVMSEEVRMRVFEKGFSTKGVGRGFGTYGMRLFAETCLGGRIHFLSTPQQGTVFYLDLPGAADS